MLRVQTALLMAAGTAATLDRAPAWAWLITAVIAVYAAVRVELLARMWRKWQEEQRDEAVEAVEQVKAELLGDDADSGG